MADVLKDFQKFLFRGNVLDLAVAVVMGAAFSAVVNGLVKDLLTPLIAAIVGKPDFSQLTFTLHHSQFAYGDLLNQLVSFLLVGAAIFYLVILPVNLMSQRFAKQAPAPAPSTKQCAECCSDIPIAARRCKYCTAAQA